MNSNNKMEQKRYNKSTYIYTSYFLVVCPKCGKEATINSNRLFQEDVKLNCPHCMYNTKYADQLRYKISIKHNCPECGKNISAEKDNLKKPIKEISVICSNCGFNAVYTSKVLSYIPVKELNGLKGDPYFNFPLTLQTEVKGNLFWAYNREHLDEIEKYVEAELRERTSAYLMTMAARLPHFIKDAKNRNDILKAIRLLREK